jgi:serine/threonine protein kinase/tetratricopeptide (TPR) repeat protein
MHADCPGLLEFAHVGGTDGRATSFSTGLAAHIEDCPDCRERLKRYVDDGLESLPAPPGELPATDAAPRIDGFTIERELGRGAMGVVYLARRDTLRRQVAVKLLPGGRRAGPRERRQWLREAEAAAQVRHPHVVTLHEVAETDDWFLLVLEFIPGGTLADRLAEPLIPRSAARLTETIARAVHHIHQCGQLHLDLKPSNILLDGELSAGWDAVTPKVSDFGIARTAEPGATDTGPAGPGGTPSYMAPEQITRARKDLTASADIHGLGAILYHMLTGRPPYQGATILETIDLVKRHDPIPPRRLNPRIPADLETICLKCLQKDPESRYSSATCLADDLGRWLGGNPILVRPVSSLEKGWRWCRQRPVAAALAAALLLTLSVGVASVTLLWRQAETALVRADENFQKSNEILGDLIDLSVGGKYGLPKVMTLDHTISVLEQIRKQLQSQAGGRPDDLTMADHLTSIELCLDMALLQARRHDEARKLMLESLARLDALARPYTSDAMVIKYRARCLNRLAEVTEGMGDLDDSVDYHKRAVQLYEDQCRVARRPESYLFLLESRHELAWLYFKRGNREHARALFAANRRLLDGLPPGYEGPTDRVRRLGVEINCTLGTDVSRAPRAEETDLLASDNPAPNSRLKSLTDEKQTPSKWAIHIAEILRHGNDQEAASAARRESEDALQLTDRLFPLASLFRQIEDIDRAERIADRIMALARYFLAKHPDQPAAHLILSQAYGQLYKNASRKGDDATVAANMKLALAAAQHASLLNPNNEVAQRAVYDLERRLADRRTNR